MRHSLRHLLLAAVLGGVGVLAIAWGRLQGEIATAEEALATFRFEEAEEALERAQSHYGSTRAPSLVRRSLNYIAAQRAAAQYWQGNYAKLIPAAEDPMSALPPDNPQLQAIVANAIFRARYAAAKDQSEIHDALNAGIAAQLAALRGSAGDPLVAHNYEYIVKLQSAVEQKGASPKPGEGGDKSALGHLGGEPQAADPTDLKIHVPLESRELQDQKEGREAGKSAPRQRRG